MGPSCSGSWAGARERQIRGSAGISVIELPQRVLGGTGWAEFHGGEGAPGRLLV